MTTMTTTTMTMMTLTSKRRVVTSVICNYVNYV
jgi:hypothetical protein